MIIKKQFVINTCAFTVLCVFAWNYWLCTLFLVDYREYPLSSSDGWVGMRMGGEFGNQLWMLASSYGIAKSRKARWCVAGNGLDYDKYLGFIEWNSPPPEQCPGWVANNPMFFYSSRLKLLPEVEGYAKFSHSFRDNPAKNIMLYGCLQSYKFFDPYIPIPFRLVSALPAKVWTMVHNVNVGIHVRRGDTLKYTDRVVPPLSYFKQAMHTLHMLFPLQEHRFVVATDDKEWVNSHALFDGMHVLSTRGDVSFDMAVLSACQHKIISIGTFGWWGAFLSDTGDNTTSAVIYPTLQADEDLAAGFSNSDFFPPHWTGLEPHTYADLDASSVKKKI